MYSQQKRNNEKKHDDKYPHEWQMDQEKETDRQTAGRTEDVGTDISQKLK